MEAKERIPIFKPSLNVSQSNPQGEVLSFGLNSFLPATCEANCWRLAQGRVKLAEELYLLETFPTSFPVLQSVAAFSGSGTNSRSKTKTELQAFASRKDWGVGGRGLLYSIQYPSMPPSTKTACSNNSQAMNGSQIPKILFLLPLRITKKNLTSLFH